MGAETPLGFYPTRTRSVTSRRIGPPGGTLDLMAELIERRWGADILGQTESMVAMQDDFDCTGMGDSRCTRYD
jgi:hypothetical protein